MACISAPTALAGASLLGSGISALGAASAADEQSQAAIQAAQIQARAARQGENTVTSMFNQGKDLLMPYTTQGTSANVALSNLIGTNPGGNPLTAALTSKFQPTLEQLSQTPGYQFTLQQGLDATQNSYAAQGLGSSGAAMKGAANYAEGLAGTTYQQQFNNNLSQNQQIYNMIAGQANMGLGAAQSVAGLAANAGNSLANLITGGAAAQAGGVMGAATAGAQGTIGVTSALGGGLSNAGMLYALGMGGGLFGRKDAGVSTSSNVGATG